VINARHWIIGISLSLGLSSPAALSATLYSYGGNNFGSTSDSLAIPGAFTTAMSVSGSFTINDPLTFATHGIFGGVDIGGDVTSYSFFNGRDYFTDANSDIQTFQFQVLSNGDLWWSIRVGTFDYGTGYGPPFVGAETQFVATAFGLSTTRDQSAYTRCTEVTVFDGPVTICTGTEADTANRVNLQGSWTATTVVPLPPAAWLLGGAVAALAGLRRKC